MLGMAGSASSWPVTSCPKVTNPLIALAYGSSSSAGLAPQALGKVLGPPHAYRTPGGDAGTKACQTSASWSRSGLGFAPSWSNRHNVTLSATLEAIAKFVPALPS